MILSKADLKEYMEEDRRLLGRRGGVPRPWDYIWRYERLLRRAEYRNNVACGPVGVLVAGLYRLRLMHMGARLGFSIPLNVFGKGLSIAHIGPIVVNGHARVGERCRVHVGVNIGTEAGFTDRAPTIGDDVYIGPGAKLFGSIEIADRIAIGANAVVNKSFMTPGISIAGVPAAKISDKGNPDYGKAGRL